MNFKKILSIITIFTIITVPIFSFADDYIENDLSLIDEEISTSSDLSDTPDINARHAVVFDRASKTVLFGKNENERCKMASTTNVMVTQTTLFFKCRFFFTNFICNTLFFS